MISMKGGMILLGVFVFLAFYLAGCAAQGPSNVTATPVAGGIDVSWNAVQGVSGYNIYRSTESGTAGSKINSALVSGETTYKDTMVSDGVTYYYTVKSVDSGGSEYGTVQASATSKISPPANLQILINSGANYTSQRTVTLSLSASGASQCRFSADGASWSDWEAYATQRSWDLVSGDGPKDVYYQCKDSLGNTAHAVSASIYLDTVPPTLSVSSPVSGSTYPASFNLVFTVTDPISETVTCSGELDGNPVEVGVVQTGAQKTLTIHANSGSRTLTVRCSDGVLAADRSITFNVVDKPTVSISLGDGSGYTATTTVYADVVATHATDCRFSNDGTSWGNWQPYTERTQLYLPGGDGTKYVYVECRGAGGTVSDPADDSIILDTSPPPYISISINNDARWTSSRSVTLGLYAFAASQCRLAEDNRNWGPWEAYRTRESYTLSSPEGDKTIYYNCRDRTGKDVGTASAAITYSPIPPDPPTNMRITINNGASYTTSANVYLDLYAKNAYECRIQQDNYGWSSWNAYRTSQSFTLSGGDGSKTIYYQCRNEYGTNTVHSSIYLDTGPPSPIYDLTGTAGYNSIVLRWSRPSGTIAGYNIYRSNVAFGLFAKIASTTSTSYMDYGVTDGETYAYTVRVLDRSGQESGDSNVVQVTYGGPYVGPVESGSDDPGPIVGPLT